MPKKKDRPWTTKDMENETGIASYMFAKWAREGKMPAWRAGDGPKAPYLMDRKAFLAWWKGFYREVEPWRPKAKGRPGSAGKGSGSCKELNIRRLPIDELRKLCRKDGE